MLLSSCATSLLYNHCPLVCICKHLGSFSYWDRTFAAHNDYQVKRDEIKAWTQYEPPQQHQIKHHLSHHSLVTSVCNAVDTHELNTHCGMSSQGCCDRDVEQPSPGIKPAEKWCIWSQVVSAQNVISKADIAIILRCFWELTWPREDCQQGCLPHACEVSQSACSCQAWLEHARVRSWSLQSTLKWMIWFMTAMTRTQEIAHSFSFRMCPTLLYHPLPFQAKALTGWSLL